MKNFDWLSFTLVYKLCFFLMKYISKHILKKKERTKMRDDEEPFVYERQIGQRIRLLQDCTSEMRGWSTEACIIMLMSGCRSRVSVDANAVVDNDSLISFQSVL
jgi:hypothetical protein